MASRNYLDLPAEIRNNIYRQILCYDGITPEVRPAQSPWQSRTFNMRAWTNARHMHQNSRGDFVDERSRVRMHLDVVAPVRNGIYPGVQLPVFASDILSLLCACRQINQEAHPIFWAENAFIFPDQDTMHAFTNRIGAKSLNLIRTLGIEKTVNAEWINVNGGIDLGYWFADARISPFLQAHLYGWEAKFEDYGCERAHWVPDRSDPSEVKIRKLMIRCKTTYNWLTRPPTSEALEVKSIKGSSGVADDGLFETCALEYSLRTLLDST